MQETGKIYTKVMMDGLNQMEHEETIRNYREKGWTLFAATPDTAKRKMIYRFLEPRSGIRPA